ncbi:DNA cytosine methyltransferase [Escherichia coli]|nr:DNA cytosine methyltransferase [Escherichia coli]MCN8584321.1 DNA cytosine methyltransferase [Escherichia coli]MCO0481245.1 DNA cytosine methyltransferase [Escherichia coli]
MIILSSKKFISLFSGAMGLDLGLEEAGFELVACVEQDKAALKTIKTNKPNLAVFEGSIVDCTGSELLALAGVNDKEEIDLVAGGPPCQAFSVFGNRLGLEDARGQLIFEYVRMIKELNPKVFVMENVRGLLSMSIVPASKKKELSGTIAASAFEKGSLIKRVANEFNKLGYHVDCFVVNAANYGAPQIRERVILIGNRFGMIANFASPLFSNRVEDNLPPFKTLGDVIGPESGFVDNYPEVMNFSPRKLKYLSMVPPGGNWRSMPEEMQKESMGKSWYLKGGRSAYWRKLSFQFPSPTVVTMPNHAGTSMCHPTELRAISVGEAAAIQEFPDYWKFEGTTTEKFRQIGNAVPVRLGKVAGEAAMELLHRIQENKVADLVTPDYIETHIRPHIRTRSFFKNGQAYSGDVSYYDLEEEV